MSATVMVTGASSQLGVFLLPRLQAAGFSIQAMSRKVTAGPVKVAGAVQWCSADTRAEPAGVDALVSCGPLSLAVELAGQSESMQRLVAFSTTSVLSKADSGNRAESRQMVSLLADEKRLQAVCKQRAISLLLLRPTLIYGCGLDQNISLLARFGKRFGFIPVAGKAAGLRQPVHADDLAALAVNALLIEPAVDLASAAGGGSTLTYREMVHRLAASLPGVRPVSIPAGVFGAVAALASLLPGFHGVNAEMVRRQATDLVFDDHAVRVALDYDPRPFRPGPADFSVPAEAGKLQLG